MKNIKNNILYPILIIIFSLLIVYFIMKNKYDKKLTENIEKFENNYIKNNKDQLLKNVLNNSKFTKENANGTWTTIGTTVDSNYNATNLMNINIDKIISDNDVNINNSYKIMRDKDGTLLVIEKDEKINNDKKKEYTQSFIIKNNIKKNIDYDDANKLMNIKLNNPLLKFLKI